ncbi:protein ELF4-LIKE 4-like [Phragmites australis]|uniref:protein ELF4-LIKE 4-like n=1 Tax=Phragmites australis TaxID=29695 RepID=UPI002D769D9F|nr:protein ELF4-LIKE 4-like [Phragmites australis]
MDEDVGAGSVGNGGREAFLARAGVGAGAGAGTGNGIGEGIEVDPGVGGAGGSGVGKLPQLLQRSFDEVQGILEQNRVLIQEISQNQKSRDADGLSRNVGLIRELNTNISRVVDLYANFSGSFSRSVAAAKNAAAAKEAAKRPHSAEQ